MEKTLATKFRLVEVIQTQSNDLFTLTLADQSAHNYGPDYRDWNEFDTHQEALEHAKNSEKWSHKVFTILPLYYISIIH